MTAHRSTPTPAKPTHSKPSQAKQPRADARRSIAAILDAAIACLRDDPSASLGEIAKAAGVGRVTVYSHFSNRAELLQAVLDETMRRSHESLEDVDLSGAPTEALTSLVGASWTIVDEFRAVLHAAQRELPADAVHDAHGQVMERLRGVVERGRSSGDFRTDVPTDWLVTTVVTLVHGAADEVRAGRFGMDEAAGYLTSTVLSALAPRSH
ncbi:TetR/AcrR family transcriptional regulator [Knoellia subterranea]|uniref:TetR family transcriptional regulator n=1 Tax=Knoellia subterranea KCTC 19937 TaxID=1385521 RepID=A0A0A0JK94_9MICO|nr:TetR/AcrR family transcriptional regulator [Knoellia subterranea]KGN37194.1 TetR family transcriptional regulator [Knoellia subterranea KCTC 19937]